MRVSCCGRRAGNPTCRSFEPGQLGRPEHRRRPAHRQRQSRLKFGIALDGGGIGDAWVRAHGGIERFNIWAPGGTRVLTNAAGTTGVTIAAGAGSWSTLSDRNAKRDFEAVDPRDVLERVAAMPVYRWRYAEERAAAAHMGPVAQDFRAAFGLGDGDRTIATVDADGVALAAIQGLNAKVDAKVASAGRGAGRARRADRAAGARDRRAARGTVGIARPPRASRVAARRARRNAGGIGDGALGAHQRCGRGPVGRKQERTRRSTTTFPTWAGTGSRIQSRLPGKTRGRAVPARPRSRCRPPRQRGTMCASISRRRNSWKCCMPSSIGDWYGPSSLRPIR